MCTYSHPKEMKALTMLPLLLNFFSERKYRYNVSEAAFRGPLQKSFLEFIYIYKPYIHRERKRDRFRSGNLSLLGESAIMSLPLALFYV